LPLVDRQDSEKKLVYDQQPNTKEKLSLRSNLDNLPPRRR
jgi:hypothetical protein